MVDYNYLLIKYKYRFDTSHYHLKFGRQWKVIAFYMLCMDRKAILGLYHFYMKIVEIRHVIRVAVVWQ